MITYDYVEIPGEYYDGTEVYRVIDGVRSARPLWAEAEGRHEPEDITMHRDLGILFEEIEWLATRCNDLEDQLNAAR